jgi:hypothetical protein
VFSFILKICVSTEIEYVFLWELDIEHTVGKHEILHTLDHNAGISQDSSSFVFWALFLARLGRNFGTTDKMGTSGCPPREA